MQRSGNNYTDIEGWVEERNPTFALRGTGDWQVIVALLLPNLLISQNKTFRARFFEHLTKPAFSNEACLTMPSDLCG